MNRTHRGSCLCGQVRFEIEGDFTAFFLCHCSFCRKDTGSAHAANLFSASARLSWLAGRELVRDFKLAGTRHARSFCPVCGSALPCVQAGGAMLVVPAGSLDTAVDMRPTAHLFAASRASWDHGLESVASFAALPPGDAGSN